MGHQMPDSECPPCSSSRDIALLAMQHREAVIWQHKWEEIGDALFEFLGELTLQIKARWRTRRSSSSHNGHEHHPSLAIIDVATLRRQCHRIHRALVEALLKIDGLYGKPAMTVLPPCPNLTGAFEAYHAEKEEEVRA